MRRRPRHDAGALGCFLVSFVLVGAATLVPVIAWESTHGEATCTVEERDRVHGNGGSDMRIYCEDGSVFQVADDPFQGQWNSADTFAQIEPGETYTFETVGWRNGFFSQFPNVVSATAPLP